MLDFSMGELGLIAAVALIVLGPDKLPAVAKTAGTLMGKAQRLVSQVKSDIDKEVELSELKKIQEDARKMAANIETELKSTQDAFQKNVDSVQESVNKLDSELKAETQKVSAVQEEWAKSVAPKPNDAPSESVPTEGAEKVATEEKETFGWGDTPELDTSELDSAFNWGKEDIEAFEEKQKESRRFEKREIPSPTIEDLMREIERLRAEVNNGRPVAVQDRHASPFARGSRTNRTRITR